MLKLLNIDKWQAEKWFDRAQQIKQQSKPYYSFECIWEKNDKGVTYLKLPTQWAHEEAVKKICIELNEIINYVKTKVGQSYTPVKQF